MKKRYRCVCRGKCVGIIEINETTRIRAELKAEEIFLSRPCYPEEQGVDCECGELG